MNECTLLNNITTSCILLWFFVVASSWEKRNILPLHHALDENLSIIANVAIRDEKTHKEITSLVNQRFLVAFFRRLATEPPIVDKQEWSMDALSRHESQRTVVIAQVFPFYYSCHPKCCRIINNTNMDAHKPNHILLAPIMGGDELAPPPPLSTLIQEDDQAHHECPQNMVAGIWRRCCCCCSCSWWWFLIPHIFESPFYY